MVGETVTSTRRRMSRMEEDKKTEEQPVKSSGPRRVLILGQDGDMTQCIKKFLEGQADCIVDTNLTDEVSSDETGEEPGEAPEGKECPKEDEWTYFDGTPVNDTPQQTAKNLFAGLSKEGPSNAWVGATSKMILCLSEQVVQHHKILQNLLEHISNKSLLDNLFLQKLADKGYIESKKMEVNRENLGDILSHVFKQKS
jgi:hypothetical protein